MAEGRKRGLSTTELKGFYNRLLADDLWNNNGNDSPDAPRQIIDWIISDLDGNGQKDMLVMAGEGGGLVPGVIWFYFNEEPVCVLKEEKAYDEENFYFGFGFWDDILLADVDNDGNQELLFTVFNGGNGGPGGHDICLFRHVGGRWEECVQELPNDQDSDSEYGLQIDVICTDVDRYEAYCPYLDDRIAFEGKNSRDISEEEFASGHTGGRNVRGFYDFQCITYEGKNALQCREYLSGEGGNAHCVGIAVFILTWDADGVCRAADWRVDGVK